jgi:hypothetical protein
MSAPALARRGNARTLRALVTKYGGPVVPLGEICQFFFALAPEEAARKFNAGELAIPAFRLCDSRKAPILVACEDLAAHIDAAKERASRQFERHARNRGEL